MKLPSESGTFEPCPAGNHLATCIAVIDLGTQTQTYEGETTVKPQVFIQWEIPGETMSDGQPFTIGCFYTLSSNENAKLRQHLEAWRGKPFTPEEFGTFDIKNIIGQSCFLNVIEKQKKNGEMKTVIDRVAPVVKGMKAPEMISEPLYFDFEESPDAFDRVREGLQKIIMQSPEYEALNGSASKPSGMPDIPKGPSATADADSDESPF